MKVTIEKNEKGFGYITLKAGPHNHIRIRVWINRVFDGEALEFPVQNAQVVKTQKGNLVLRPNQGIVYLAEIDSGYRGNADISRIEGGEIMAKGHKYHSPQGHLGETAWALVNAHGSIKVYGQRSGRRVVGGDVAVEYLPDGKVIELLEDEELDEML